MPARPRPHPASPLFSPPKASLPWSDLRGVEDVTAHWLRTGQVRDCFAAQRDVAPSSPALGSMPDLDAGLVRALNQRGIDALYTHQVQAIDAARRGRHVVVATPTASGKSLCFHLPVLQAIADDPTSSALFLYPTKALSRDQEYGLHALAREAGLQVPATVYDGDTPGDARRVAREKCRVILSNPDMLHAGILPNHAKWATWLRGLRYVVLDELHTYRGVFGSHMAHVIARLRRVAAFHGAAPKFICATATIGNPREHTARLLGVPESDVELVDQSGAPSAARKVLVYNPPIVNAELSMRASTLKAAVHLTTDLVRARVPTILFGPSRNSVEVMLKYLRDACSDVAGESAIMGYRGGYLPETRRGIERGLRNGEILCVVATNALELGIDIGDLDAVVCAGYPGSVAGTWQRFGRAGRRGSNSIALLVCSSSAVDQYLAREPNYLLEGGAEEARIDPNNVEVLIQHLKCAAFEAPFVIRSPGPRLAAPRTAAGEGYGGLDAETTRDALEYLRGHGLVHESGGKYHWAGDAFPANHVSLRNVGWDNFVIVDVGTDQQPKETVIGEMDYRSAHTMLHEQAIYQQDAEQFQVERLDFDNHKAYVRKVEPDYFTTALTYRTVTVIEPNEALERGRVVTGWGEVKVIEKVTGYKKIKFFTHENSGYGDVHLPEMEMHTLSFWLTVPEETLATLDVPRAALIDALRGIGSALETVSSLALMCDPRDIGQTLGDGGERGVEERPGSGELSAPGRNPHAGQTGQFDPTIFLFDAIPGGVGLSERIYERADELVGRAWALIDRCPCEAGCPACVGPVESGGRKALALELLHSWGITAPPTLH